MANNPTTMSAENYTSFKGRFLKGSEYHEEYLVSENYKVASFDTRLHVASQSDVTSSQEQYGLYGFSNSLSTVSVTCIPQVTF